MPKIVFPNSPTAFTFSSDAENLEVGDLVAAPLRAKILNGVVVAISRNEPDFATRKIEKIVRPKVLSDERVELAKFIREYYSAHFGKVFEIIFARADLVGRAGETQIENDRNRRRRPAREKIDRGAKKKFSTESGNRKNRFCSAGSPGAAKPKFICGQFWKF